MHEVQRRPFFNLSAQIMAVMKMTQIMTFLARQVCVAVKTYNFDPNESTHDGIFYTKVTAENMRTLL